MFIVQSMETAMTTSKLKSLIKRADKLAVVFAVKHN